MLVTQSCPTLSDPMDYSPPGSSIHGTKRLEGRRSRVRAWLGDRLPGYKPQLDHPLL